MKKILIISAFAFASFNSWSQDAPLTSKSGTPILPETKDWGVGFDAAPFFDVIKGAFTKSDSTGTGTGYTNFTKNHPLTLYGKLVRNPTTIWRLSARIYYGSGKTNYVTLLDSSDGSSFTTPKYGNDVVKDSRQGLILGFGIEKRRGKGRVQGYYGPEVLAGFGSSKSTASYANQITQDDQVPTISPAFTVLPDNIRITEQKGGSQFNLTLRGFVGIEYFFMAKASIGAELGWGIGYSSHGEPSSSIEVWNVNLNSGSGGVDRERIPGDSFAVGKTSSFNIDSDNAYGAINLLFYF